MESLALLPSLYASNLREKLLKTEYIMLSKMYVLFCKKNGSEREKEDFLSFICLKIKFI